MAATGAAAPSVQPIGLHALLAAALACLDRPGEAHRELAAFVEKQPGVTLSQLRHRRAPTQAAADLQARFVGGLAFAGLPEHLAEPDVSEPYSVVPAVLARTDTQGLHAMLRGSASPMILVAEPEFDIKIGGSVAMRGSGAAADVKAREVLRARLDRLTRGNPAQPFVTKAWNAASDKGRDLGLGLLALGYRNVIWCRGGTEAWLPAKLPVERLSRSIAQAVAEPDDTFPQARRQ